ncbi:mannitol dehydrogenase family protein, partial [Enterobacter hormaechei]
MENRLLQAKATHPQYDRDSLNARIVHLGFGAFHRAHQAVYTDILAAEQGSDWGYCEVNLIGGEQLWGGDRFCMRERSLISRRKPWIARDA